MHLLCFSSQVKVIDQIDAHGMGERGNPLLDNVYLEKLRRMGHLFMSLFKGGMMCMPKGGRTLRRELLDIHRYVLMNGVQEFVRRQKQNVQAKFWDWYYATMLTYDINIFILIFSSY